MASTAGNPGIKKRRRDLEHGINLHHFYTTLTNYPGYDYPSYYTTRSINDITVYWYDSKDLVVQRRVPWFQSPYPSLLEASFVEYDFQLEMEKTFQGLQDYLDTSGLPILQRLTGCNLYDNSTASAIFSFHYDGKPLLTFHVEEAFWTAEVKKAQSIADSLNKNKTELQENRDLLLNTCTSHAKELLSMGNCTFTKRERPVVTVTQTPITNSTYRLHCRAYGHYPKDINMTWYRNGQQISEDIMDRVTLPYPDITYLTWLSLNITPSPDDVYTCSVTHSSMMAPFTEDWRLSVEPKEASRGISTGGVIAICVAVILLASIAIFISISLTKRSRHKEEDGKELQCVS
ncbi:major histocompatibility complex class I-related gene protein-like [Hyperolius riggenbachi]|uniref:major histocompatibility complex class I-related gene protein-like n=1 Tax=Hyperolius riggenbachi TaxID=752182 RepID=UPI0035A32E4D